MAPLFLLVRKLSLSSDVSVGFLVEFPAEVAGLLLCLPAPVGGLVACVVDARLLGPVSSPCQRRHCATAGFSLGAVWLDRKVQKLCFACRSDSSVAACRLPAGIEVGGCRLALLGGCLFLTIWCAALAAFRKLVVQGYALLAPFSCV